MRTSRRLDRAVTMAVFAIGALLTTPVWATTYHMAPHGSDGQSGRSSDAAWATFDYATAHLSPGDTLVLADGVYKPSRNDNLDIRCDHSNVSQGRADARITIRAAHERRAWIKTNGRADAVRLVDCRYWDLEGLRASGADLRGGATAVVDLARSSHVRLRRFLVHDANGNTNSAAVGFQSSHHVLVEDTEVYRFHRHGVSAYQSDHLTFRRVYVNARGAEDLGGWGSHRCCTHGGDEGFSFYFTSNSTIENSISIDSEGLSVIAGLETVLGNPGGRNNQVLGSISLGDLRPHFTQSRNFNNRPYSGAADNILFKDMLVVGGPDTAAMTISGTKNFTLRNATWLNSRQTPFMAMTATRHLSDRDFVGCSAVGGCDYNVENVIYKNNDYNHGALLRTPNGSAGLNFQIRNSNAWSADAPGRGFSVGENVADGSGRYRHSSEVKPTGIGLGRGQCAVFVPKSSNMHAAGAGGADIGANILYRYHNRHLTDQPLWNPDTGRFPCGKRIPGSPNGVAGDSCYDVHQTLNVNTNGCQLPYGSDKKANDGGPKQNGPPYQFKVTSHGDRAHWIFEATGDMSGHKIDSDTDEVADGHAEGVVLGGADAVNYTGELTKMDVEEGHPDVWVRGKQVAGGSQSARHRLVIEGYGDSVSQYRIRVHGGLSGQRTNPEDHIHYNEAAGAVSNGKDIYSFNGDLDILEVAGQERVYLDGTLLRDGTAARPTNNNHNDANAKNAGRLRGAGGGFVGQAGKVSVRQENAGQWHRVKLDHSYKNALVVMGPLSYHGSDPSTVRVQNVHDNRFDFQIDEWDYLDGAHSEEQLGYLIIKNGPTSLADGTPVDSGKMYLDERWKHVSFSRTYSRKPVVVAQVQTRIGPAAVTIRQRNVTRSGFDLRLQEEEGYNDGHSTEKVGYVVLPPGRHDADTPFRVGRTGLTVEGMQSQHTPKWHTIHYNTDAPNAVFLASIQTYNGPDTAALRYRTLTSNHVDVFAEEDRSVTDWMGHGPEDVGWMIFDISTVNYHSSNLVETAPSNRGGPQMQGAACSTTHHGSPAPVGDAALALGVLFGLGWLVRRRQRAG